MAFLCPVRIRRNKKKKDNGEDHSIPQLGRITGSSSIETLVRVGLEKEAGISPDSRMLVLHDFTPCVDDELEVKKGDFVSLLYRENDWAYVIDERRPLGQQNEGFIPYSYITPFLQDSNKHLSSRNKKPPREETNSTASSNAASSMISAASASSEIHPFFKDPSLGRFVVLYSFTARDENDIDVHRGELITVLNKDDSDWFWIIRDYDGQEGFVPAAFIYPLIVSVPASSGSSSNGNSHQSGHHSGHSGHRITNGHGHQQQLPLPPPPTQNSQNSNPHSTSNSFTRVNNLISATSGLHITSTNSSSGLPLHPLTAPTSMPLAMAMSPPNYYNTKLKEPDSIRIQTSAITAIPAINSNNTNGHLNSNSSNHLQMTSSTSTSLPALMPTQGPGQLPPGDLTPTGTELIMLYDYKAQVSDDLSVRRGDWVYADLTCQPVEGWLWAYAPKQKKYGFVPKAYARPPAMTSL